MPSDSSVEVSHAVLHESAVLKLAMPSYKAAVLKLAMPSYSSVEVSHVANFAIYDCLHNLRLHAHNRCTSIFYRIFFLSLRGHQEQAVPVL